MVKARTRDTRQRLIDATLELVAERGFDGVGVGDIEAGAGLAPRSGALYKYFDSKLAVLEAGLEQHLAAIDEVEADIAEAPAPGAATDAETATADTNADTEVEALARWLLLELDRERTITHVIEREGDRLPELRDRMRRGVSDRGYLIAAAFIARWARTVTDEPLDHEALAVILVGSVINLRRSAWTFGAAPLGIDDERFVATFAALSAALLDLGTS